MIRPKSIPSTGSRNLAPAKLAAARGGSDRLPPLKLKPFPNEADKDGDGILDDDYLMEPSIP